jgi:hypothetical protein
MKLQLEDNSIAILIELVPIPREKKKCVGWEREEN